MSEKVSRLDLEKLLKIANVGIYKTTPDGKIIYVNEFLSKMLGYDNPDELTDRNLEDVSYFDPEFPRSRFKESIEKKGYFKGESCWMGKNGKKVYVMEFAIKTEDVYGQVYYVGMVEDITPQVEAYHEEKRLRKEWVNLFNAVPDSVIILSEDQTILDVNEATLKLLNTSKEDIVGKKCYRVFHHTNSPPAGCPFVAMMETKDYSGFSEMVMDTVGGKYLVTVGLYDEVNGEKRIIHFAKDVNQIYDMREKLITSLERYNKILILINSINKLFLKERNEKKLISEVCRVIKELKYIEGSCVMLVEGNAIKFESKCECEGNLLHKLLKEKPTNRIMFNTHGKRLIFFPMMFENENVGYLGIVVSVELKDEEFELLESIASDLGYVIRQIRLEREKKIVYDELERNLEDLTVLVDGIRNPLAVIMGIAEVELDGELKAKIEEEIEKINQVTKRVDKIWRRSEHLREYLEKGL